MLRSLSVLAVLCLSAVTAQQQPSVNTTSGTIYGSYVNNNTVAQYLGIPYATPPVNQLRFTYPTPYTGNYTNGTLNATTLVQECSAIVAGDLTGSEDCLYIDVWVPANNNSRPAGGYPVFAYIPGGEFVNTVYQTGAPLVENSDSVVVVYIRYRVGTQGYLALPGAAAEVVGTSSAGMYGSADQIAALEWINSNIESFGGDPSAVTVGGQSAGSTSVCYLLNSPLASGLFRSAVLMSGGCDSLQRPYPYNQSETATPDNYQVSQLVATAANCTAPNTTTAGYTAQLQCMRNLTATQLWTAYLSINPNNATSNFDWSTNKLEPFVDGYIVTQNPAYNFNSTHNSTFNNVPIITGNNRNEGGYWGAIDLTWQPSSATNTDGITFNLPLLYTEQFVNNTQNPLYGKYTPSTEPLYTYYVNAQNPFEVYAGASLGAFLSQEDIITTGLLACPVRRQARAIAATNQTAYTYELHYNWDTNPFQAIGTVIGTDLPFWFYSPSSTNPSTGNVADIQTFTPQQSQLAAQMQTYLVNFITNTDPNNSTNVNVTIAGVSTTGLPVWPQYNVTSGLYLSFGNGTIDAAPINTVYEPFGVSCDLWDQYVVYDVSANVTCQNNYTLSTNHTCVAPHNTTSNSLLAKLRRALW